MQIVNELRDAVVGRPNLQQGDARRVRTLARPPARDQRRRSRRRLRRSPRRPSRSRAREPGKVAESESTVAEGARRSATGSSPRRRGGARARSVEEREGGLARRRAPSRAGGADLRGQADRLLSVVPREIGHLEPVEDRRAGRSPPSPSAASRRPRRTPGPGRSPRGMRRQAPPASGPARSPVPTRRTRPMSGRAVQMLAIDDFGRPSRRASSLGPSGCAGDLGEQVEDRRRPGHGRSERLGISASDLVGRTARLRASVRFPQASAACDGSRSAG